MLYLHQLLKALVQVFVPSLLRCRDSSAFLWLQALMARIHHTRASVQMRAILLADACSWSLFIESISSISVMVSSSIPEAFSYLRVRSIVLRELTRHDTSGHRWHFLAADNVPSRAHLHWHFLPSGSRLVILVIRLKHISSSDSHTSTLRLFDTFLSHLSDHQFNTLTSLSRCLTPHPDQIIRVGDRGSVWRVALGGRVQGTEWCLVNVGQELFLLVFLAYQKLKSHLTAMMLPCLFLQDWIVLYHVDYLIVCKTWWWVSACVTIWFVKSVIVILRYGLISDVFVWSRVV